MKKWILVPLALLALLHAVHAHCAPLDALPNTPIGKHARAWFEAYADGSPQAIEAYANAHVGAGARAQNPLERRIATMQAMKKEHGALTVVDVPEEDSDQLVVLARDEHGEKITVSFRSEPNPPFLLAGMRVERGEPSRTAEGPPLDEAALAAAVRAELDRRPEFSGVVLVARADRTIVQEARGVADRKTGAKITLDTKFNLASICKMFTKLALAQLAAEGKLSLDDPITRWLPQYKVANAEKITLAQLVEHRGGVDDVLDRAHEVHDRTTLTTADGWLSLILDRPLVFAPGTSQRYSNGGYVLLGGAIAKASGEDYYDYVAKHVFAPAGMTETSWPLAHQPLANRAEGYTRHPEGLRHDAISAAEMPIRDLLPERGSAAGGGTSTAPDLLRFMRALRSSKLASPGWTAWVLGGPVPGPGATLPDGIGMAIAGGSPGVNGEIQFEGKYDVIVLTNADPPNAEELSRALNGLVRRAGA